MSIPEKNVNLLRRHGINTKRFNFSEGNHLQHEEALEFVFSFSMRPRVTILNNNTEKKRRDLAQKKKTE